MNLDRVERVCLFVGYPRSGHSLVGSLIDSHPQAAVSHEQDLLADWRSGMGWPELGFAVLKNCREQALRGRVQSGYSYALPNQGKTESPVVLGDKKGGRTATYLLRQPDLLHRFQETTPWPIYLIHVLRDPRDNIATMSIMHEIPLEKAMASYWQRSEAVAALKHDWPAGRFLDIHLEKLLLNPDGQIARLFEFLALPLDGIPGEQIGELLFDNPKQTRGLVDWSSCYSELTQRVNNSPCHAPYR